MRNFRFFGILATSLWLGTGCAPSLRDLITQISTSPTSAPPATMSFSVITFATGYTADQTFNVIITAKDLQGVTLTNYTGTIHFTTSSTLSTLPSDYTFVPADNGTKTFVAGAQLKTVGSQSLTVTDTSNSSNTGSRTLTISPGAFSLAQSTLSVSSSSVASASSITATLTAKDAYGNQNPTGVVAVTMPASGGTSTFTDMNPTPTNLGSGVYQASYTGLVAGTATTIAPTINAGATTATQAVTVTFGTASALSYSTHPGGGTSSTAWATQPVVRVLDAAGNLVTSSSAPVTLAINNNPGSGTLTTTLTVAASSGVATFSGLKIDKAGTGYTLDATSSGLSSATSNAFNITAGSLHHFSVSGYASSSQCDAASTVTVTAQDSANNTVTSYTGTIHFSAFTDAAGTTTDTGATLPGNYTFVGGDSGTHNFAGVALHTVSTTSMIKVNDTTTSSIIGTQTGITVTVRAASVLAFTTQPGGGTGGTAWGTQPVVAVRDSCGNTITSASDTITMAIGTNAGPGGVLSGTNPVNTSSGVATFTNLKIDKIGTGYTITASSGNGYTGATSNTFNITVGTATKLGFTQQPTNSTAGATFATQPKVAVQDAGGNTVTSSTASIAMAIGTNPASGTLSGTTPVNASSGVATFTDLSINNAGTGYTIVASSTGLTSATSNTFNITSSVSGTYTYLTQDCGSSGSAIDYNLITSTTNKSYLYDGSVGDTTTNLSQAYAGCGTRSVRTLIDLGGSPPTISEFNVTASEDNAGSCMGAEVNYTRVYSSNDGTNWTQQDDGSLLIGTSSLWIAVQSAVAVRYWQVVVGQFCGGGGGLGIVVRKSDVRIKDNSGDIIVGQ